MYILITVIALVVLLLATLIARALAFRPKDSIAVYPKEWEIDSNRVALHLSEMVQCRTVSSNDERLVDVDEFDRFRTLLPTMYPKVHEVATVESIGATGLLYTIKGVQDSSPTVLMSHYDVVPALEQYWDVAPFSGLITDNAVHGRGTLDTKGTLCGIMESLEALLNTGFSPKNDILLAFSGDEEIAGESAPAIVAELKKRNIRPAMVVDEGGAVVENMFPGVAVPTALIGTAEKGMLDLKLKVKSKGGHASSPPPHTPVGILADAIVKIENKPFKFTLTPPVKTLLDTLGRHSSFFYRLIFANLWLFTPVLDLLCKKTGGELNAMMRTTCAFTMMEGSNATNVIPPEASIGANLRIISGESYESSVEKLKRNAKNDDIEFEVVYAMNPSSSSST
ncbi:MAG: M20/M25/M40 family metallo-hydrolase, partial [Oscillospiraceae bacterium]|nr:M20/M25/M40 family metallo-hydrolase [Oscillospiraceae bacterium]